MLWLTVALRALQFGLVVQPLQLGKVAGVLVSWQRNLRHSGVKSTWMSMVRQSAQLSAFLPYEGEIRFSKDKTTYTLQNPATNSLGILWKKGGGKNLRARGTKISAVRLCLLYMTKKLHPKSQQYGHLRKTWTITILVDMPSWWGNFHGAPTHRWKATGN